MIQLNDSEDNFTRMRYMFLFTLFCHTSSFRSNYFVIVRKNIDLDIFFCTKMYSILANIKSHNIYEKDFDFKSRTSKYFYTFVFLGATYFYQFFFYSTRCASFFQYIIETFTVIYR